MIPVFSYIEQYKSIEDEIMQAISRVFQSGRLILGKEVDAFENNFSDYLGNDTHGVAVNSGTDALVVALMALGIGNGDEVITVANTAVPTVSAIRMTGATPVFCDVESSSALIDISQLENHLTNKTKAVVAVHLYGNVVDIEAIKSVIGNRNIFIVEDCAQAHGATLNGKKVGTLGDVAAFSFYPTKNLGAFGDAGFACSRNKNIVDEMRKVRMYGFDGGYYSMREGINSRMDEVQAAILNIKLEYLPEQIERRRKLAKLYDNLLDEKLGRLSSPTGVNHAYHLYVVKSEKRNQVQQSLLEKGIQTGIHYPYPIHLMSGYHFLGYQTGSLPVTEMLSDKVLSLPMFPELNEDSVSTVCQELNKLL